MKDLLISDHLELDSILELLFTALDKGDAAEVYKELNFFWARLAMHIRAENLHLFPAILKAAQIREQDEAGNSEPARQFVCDSIDKLKNDHNFFMRELGDAIKKMVVLREDNWTGKDIILSALREKLTALCERLKKHNELEEAEVYRWPEIFMPADVPILQAKIQKELENLPPRFITAG